MRYTIRISSSEPGTPVAFEGIDMGLGSKTATVAACRSSHDGGLIAIRVPGRSFQNGNYGALSRSYAPAEIVIVRVMAHLMTGGLLVEDVLEIPVKGVPNAKPIRRQAHR